MFAFSIVFRSRKNTFTIKHETFTKQLVILKLLGYCLWIHVPIFLPSSLSNRGGALCGIWDRFAVRIYRGILNEMELRRSEWRSGQQSQALKRRCDQVCFTFICKNLAHKFHIPINRQKLKHYPQKKIKKLSTENMGVTFFTPIWSTVRRGCPLRRMTAEPPVL